MQTERCDYKIICTRTTIILQPPFHPFCDHPLEVEQCEWRRPRMESKWVLIVIIVIIWNWILIFDLLQIALAKSPASPSSRLQNDILIVPPPKVCPWKSRRSRVIYFAYYLFRFRALVSTFLSSFLCMSHRNKHGRFGGILKIIKEGVPRITHRELN